MTQNEKLISWSYSKLKGFADCPKRMYETMIAKSYKDQSSQLEEGDKIHKAMEHALTGHAPLPPSMGAYQKWIDEVRTVPGELLVEQKWGVKKDLKPTSFKDWDGAWFRGIADALKLGAAEATAWDWKNGNPKYADDLQLAIVATCVFSHYPTCKTVTAKFVFLSFDFEVEKTYTREILAEEVWPDELGPKVLAYTRAVRTQTFPPKPGFLCAKYCPVLSCPYHGKRPS